MDTILDSETPVQISTSVDNHQEAQSDSHTISDDTSHSNFDSLNDTDSASQPIQATTQEPSTSEIFSKLALESSSENGTPRSISNQISAPKKVDFSSKEAFPELGSSSAPKNKFATQWGKPSAATGISKSSMLGSKSVTPKSTEVIDLPLGQIVPRESNSRNRDNSKNRSSNQNASVSEIVKQIMSETNTQIEVSRAAKLKTMTFIVTGDAKNVAKAKREICSQLSPQINIVIQVPVVVRRFLIGTKGQTLANIQLQSGANISLPKREDSVSHSKDSEKSPKDFDNDDLLEVFDVTISGDVQGVAMAKAAIEEIVSKKTSIRGARLSHIPCELYPFIAGPSNKNINEWTKEFPGLHLRVPIIYSDFSTSGDNKTTTESTDIAISGEREAVSTIVTRIEEMADDLRRNLRKIQISLPKRQHRFIIGPKGSNISEILESTNCSVEVPSLSDPSTNITIRGPQNNLMDAMTKVMEKANSVYIDTLDLSTINSSNANLTYGWRLYRYLQAQRIFKKLEQDHSVNIYPPRSLNNYSKPLNPEDLILEIVGKDEKSVRPARAELNNLCKTLPPSFFHSIDIEPHFHGHVIGRNGANATKIKTQYGIIVLTPSEPENMGNLKPARSKEVVLVYNGKNSNIQAISNPKSRVKAIEELFNSCKNEILKSIEEASNFGSETIQVENKYHRSLIGPNGSNLKELLLSCGSDEGENKIFIDFGTSSNSGDSQENSSKTNGKDSKTKSKGLSEDQISIKGPKDIVSKVSKALLKKVEDIKHHDVLYSFTQTCNIPSSYLSRVIGKGRAGLNRISASHDVTIDIADNDKSSSDSFTVLTIKGTKSGSQNAKKEIDTLVENLADQTSKVINIDSNLHRSLIGTGGRFVRRLEERYGVSIRFPASAESKSSTQNEAAESENTVSDKNPSNNLNPDEIMVRGGSKGVENAIQELMDLAKYEKDNNYSETIEVPSKHLRYLVGRQGSRITEIRNENNARIDIDRNDPENPTKLVKITVTGTSSNVKSTVKKIQDIISEQELIVEKTVDIDPKHHRYLIGPGGSFYRRIISECGGNPDLNNGPGSCKVFFPRAGSEGTDSSSSVRIVGDSKIVDKVIEKLNSIVLDRDNVVTAQISIPSNQHSFIIGRGGSKLRSLQETYNVQIDFPDSKNSKNPRKNKSNNDSAGPDSVSVTGKPENIELAKQALLSMVLKESRLEVPLALHKKLGGRESRLWYEVSSKFNANVEIDRSEIQISSDAVDSENSSSRTRNRIDQTKLLSSDGTPEDIVIDLSAEINDPDGRKTTWILKSADESSLESARQYILSKLEDAKKQNYMLMFYVDPSKYRFIIGKNGSVIQSIRAETGVQIDIPRSDINSKHKPSSSSSMVSITGDKDSVLAARSKIEKILEDQAN
ncbi:Vigilin 1 [Smittium mucronatum]|uniref:Vigilin 1 n=1 Tax=Smittium mucronatum TaxID=133383 RepID=A0A1R0GX45_9FUNG|nr:Vigilin 1 [Smittium mucronatum]